MAATKDLTAITGGLRSKPTHAVLALAELAALAAKRGNR